MVDLAQLSRQAFPPHVIFVSNPVSKHSACKFLNCRPANSADVIWFVSKLFGTHRFASFVGLYRECGQRLCIICNFDIVPLRRGFVPGLDCITCIICGMYITNLHSTIPNTMTPSLTLTNSAVTFTALNNYASNCLGGANTQRVNVVATLQEYAQANRLPLPKYTDVRQTGESHNPWFTVECSFRLLSQCLATRGEGPCKRDAKREAAVSMLRRLEEQNEYNSLSLSCDKNMPVVNNLCKPLQNCTLTLSSPPLPVPANRVVPAVARSTYRLDPNLYAELNRCEPLMTAFRACGTVAEMVDVRQSGTALALVQLIAEQCKIDLSQVLSTQATNVSSLATYVSTVAPRSVNTSISVEDDRGVALILQLSTTPAICCIGHANTFEDACEMACRNILQHIKFMKCCEKGDPFTFDDV